MHIYNQIYNYLHLHIYNFRHSNYVSIDILFNFILSLIILNFQVKSFLKFSSPNLFIAKSPNFKFLINIKNFRVSQYNISFIYQILKPFLREK